jgi:hypothetical protein
VAGLHDSSAAAGGLTLNDRTISGTVPAVNVNGGGFGGGSGSGSSGGGGQTTGSATPGGARQFGFGGGGGGGAGTGGGGAGGGGFGGGGAGGGFGRNPGAATFRPPGAASHTVAVHLSAAVSASVILLAVVPAGPGPHGGAASASRSGGRGFRSRRRMTNGVIS